MLVVIHTVRQCYERIERLWYEWMVFTFGVKEREWHEWRNNNNNNIQFECEQYNLLSQFNLHLLLMFVYCSLIALLAYAYFCRPIKTHRSQFWGVNHVTIVILCIMLVVCRVILLVYLWTFNVVFIIACVTDLNLQLYLVYTGLKLVNCRYTYIMPLVTRFYVIFGD